MYQSLSSQTIGFPKFLFLLNFKTRPSFEFARHVLPLEMVLSLCILYTLSSSSHNQLTPVAWFSLNTWRANSNDGRVLKFSKKRNFGNPIVWLQELQKRSSSANFDRTELLLGFLERGRSPRSFDVRQSQIGPLLLFQNRAATIWDLNYSLFWGMKI